MRRRHYNLFWFTHQLYVPLVALLLVHPLSGVLKEEVIVDQSTNMTNYTIANPVFVPIQSSIRAWMMVPLLLFSIDLMWRIWSRNSKDAIPLSVSPLPGRTLCIVLSLPEVGFRHHPGQYVLVQCPNLSTIEWHPFTVTSLAEESNQTVIKILVRVRGDWTEALENLAIEPSAIEKSNEHPIRFLIDGPFASPMEGLATQKVGLCVAAGVGITPFIPYLEDIYRNPRSTKPGRMHLVWIVKDPEELTWIAELVTKTLVKLRESNKPDRLHVELYVTNKIRNMPQNRNERPLETLHIVQMNGKGGITNTVEYPQNNLETSHKAHVIRGLCKMYPMLGCRIRLGRPHWDHVFGYWVHLYPSSELNLYCCGPKSLTKSLRRHSSNTTRHTKTTINLIHESFS